MPEVGTVQTPRRTLLQHQQPQRPRMTLRTVPPLERLDDDKAGLGRGSCEARHMTFFPAGRAWRTAGLSPTTRSACL